jgi:UDP-N-acetyl-2-amino-2-deoxyglucuronate dehydrogenase
MANKLQIALLGCGQNAKKHVEAIKFYADELELSAICDTNADNLARYSEPGIQAFTSLDDLLSADHVDAVVVCTPSGLHPAHVMKIAEAKKHVICEKPLAIEYVDAEKMLEVCQANKVQLFTVKQMRYLPVMQALNMAIQQGRFGQIYMATANVFWTRPQSYYDEAPWRGTKKSDGGALMNQASHYVDLLCWLLGDVKTVQARSATLGRNIEMEDACVLNLEWQSGALGNFAVTMLAYPKNFETSLTILGEHGTVKIGGVAFNEMLAWEFASKQSVDTDVQALCQVEGSVAAYCLRLYYEGVIKALKGDDVAVVSGAEGLKSLACIAAAYQSAETGGLISLPLKKG